MFVEFFLPSISFINNLTGLRPLLRMFQRLAIVWLLLTAVLEHYQVYSASEIQNYNKDVYIVYMGGVTSNGDIRNDHANLVSSLTDRDENVVVHTYNQGFLGFAARLTEEEAKSLSSRPRIVSVFPDSDFKLQTTRSWDFLEQQIVDVDHQFDNSTPTSTVGADTIIGFLDSGIWPESESFDDTDMAPIPSRWKGICMEGQNFTSSNCNRKLIGARFYDDLEFGTRIMGGPRDCHGHGTHVASTAAGRFVSGASYYGLAGGTARGGSPSSRLAMYRVCTGSIPPQCPGSAILKGFDDAIADGVDVVSVSISSSPSLTDLSRDPIAIGAFHAVEKGITVVCAAGNSGPYSGTVANVAPWILTVAATTIDREFEADVVLGGNRKIKGRGINFSNLESNPIYPLIDGMSAKLGPNQTAEISARYCVPGSLNGAKLKGKILLCDNNYNDDELVIYNFGVLKNQYGVIGLILIDRNIRYVPPKYRIHPIVAISEDDGAQVLAYIKSNSNPVATILPTIEVPNYKPAPVVAHFSSRGPTPGIEGILKPDIAAPGVTILAAWPTFATKETLEGREPPKFALLFGTSMACPHIAGLVATLKSQHPMWGPSAIRSAIMTTAINTNNVDSPITTLTGSRATPHDIGAGEISISSSLQPGLVYETELSDYIMFLCHIGYEPAKIKLIAPDIAYNFSCPVNKSYDLVSNMNYPSISISNLKGNEAKAVTRTLSNVGDVDSTYHVVVEAPSFVDVRVVPDKLRFTKDVPKLQFQVAFKMSTKSQGVVFGSIVWMSEKRNVRSPFVLIGSPNATYTSYAQSGTSISFIIFLCQMLLSWCLY